MTANELMIGDWVSLEGATIQVESNDFIQEGPTYWTVDSQESLISKFKPILFTEEILKTNRFNKEAEQYGCEGSWNYGLIEVEKCGDVWLVHIDNTHRMTQAFGVVKYVHEFQHILRIGGYSILADNLKI